MSIEAYQIGVAFVADAKKVTGPVNEMLRSLDRIIERQRDVNMGFTSMVSSLGGARRLASGLASDMERAARAAKDMAAASARFSQGGRRGWGGADADSGQSSRARNSRSGRSSGPVDAEEMPAPSMLLLPPPARQITYDPGASMRTSTAGMPGNSLLGGPGVTVGGPYGPPPPGRPPRALLMLPASQGGAGAVPGTAIPWAQRVRSAGKGAWQGAVAGGSLLHSAGGAIRNFRVPRPHHALTLPEVLGAYMGWHVISSGFEQAGTYDQTLNALAGDPRANIPALRRIADQARKTNPYLTGPDSALLAAEGYDLSGGTMKEVPDIVAMLNKADAAFNLMGKNGADAVAQSKAFVRGMDVSNRFYNPNTGQFDINRANQSANAGLSMIFANRQFMTGQNFARFAISSGAAGQHMSDEGMFNLAHFIDINPARAGNQVRSLENLFGGQHTRMTVKDYAYFNSLGLVGKNGQFKGQSLIYSDPIGWITHYLAPLIKRHPELVGRIQRMNVGDLVNETYGSTGNIARQAAAARRTSAGKAMAVLSAGSKAAQTRTEVSWENFELAVGKFAQGPGVQVLNRMTEAFNRASDYMTAHPDDMNRMGQQIGDLAKALVGASALIGKATSSIPSWLWPILGGAAVGGRIGGLWGAAAGAVGGGIYEGRQSAINWADKIGPSLGYGSPQPPGHIVTWADELDPFRFFRGKQAQNGQPVQVNLHVDGKQVSTAIVPHLTGQLSRDAGSHGSLWDPTSSPPLPGLSPGH